MRDSGSCDQGSNPCRAIGFSVEIGIDTVKPEDFENFLLIRKGLGDKTIETYVIQKFLRFLNGRDATKEIIEDYLTGIKSKRNDYAMLKACLKCFVNRAARVWSSYTRFLFFVLIQAVQ